MCLRPGYERSSAAPAAPLSSTCPTGLRFSPDHERARIRSSNPHDQWRQTSGVFSSFQLFFLQCLFAALSEKPSPSCQEAAHHPSQISFAVDLTKSLSSEQRGHRPGLPYTHFEGEEAPGCQAANSPGQKRAIGGQTISATVERGLRIMAAHLGIQGGDDGLGYIGRITHDDIPVRANGLAPAGL